MAGLDDLKVFSNLDDSVINLAAGFHLGANAPLS